jgi:hypothetical protein
LKLRRRSEPLLKPAGRRNRMKKFIVDHRMNLSEITTAMYAKNLHTGNISKFTVEIIDDYAIVEVDELPQPTGKGKREA